MCGICGIVEFAGPSPEPGVLEAMTRSLRHRGPDAKGVHLAGPVGLGHTRLSILDLSPTGSQPMFSEDGRIGLVYNGEMYNFRELRARLEGLGASFRGGSDTEVALKAYERWGADSFASFEGMFAFALWDARLEKLILARDRFGIKPLYYALFPNGAVFGSEIKALLASNRLERKLSWEALHEYLHYGTALGENTFFTAIRKLPPGGRLILDRSGATVDRFASIHDIEPIVDDLETAVEKTRTLLESAVRSHLISDVPVGVFLSGGIDSSAVTAFASRHYRGRIKTYSAGFDFEKGINELPKARLVADHFGTEHTELQIAGKNLPEVIDHLVSRHDQPFGDPANIPLYLLSQELRGEVKVILQGDGGDEIFAGYHRYSRLARQNLLKMFGPGVMLARPLIPKRSALFRGLRTIHALSHPDPALRMALLMSQAPPDSPPDQVFSEGARNLLRITDPFSRYREFYHRFRDLDPVQRMLYTDAGIILPDVYFEKVDKAAMAHGIEVRVPLVDTNLANYAMGLPSSYKVRGNQKKFLLRRALRGIVPDSILDGPKTGFGVPVDYWMRGPLSGFLKTVLLDRTVQEDGWFHRPLLERSIRDHAEGRRDQGLFLYKLLNLALWKKSYSPHL